MKLIKFIMPLFVVLNIQCKNYHEFQHLDQQRDDISFDYYQLNQGDLVDSLSQIGISVNLGKSNNGPFIGKITTDEKLHFKNVIRISQIYGDSLLITSGVRGLESGVKYFMGTYSEIYIVNTNDLTIVKKYLIDEIVTNARIVSDEVYFWYGSSANYKMGKLEI